VDRRAPDGRTAPHAPAAIDRWRLRRTVLGGLLLTAAVAGAGWLVERARFGSTEAAALARVAGEVQRDFAALADTLREATSQVASDARPRLPAGPDMGRTRALFGAAASIVQAHPDVDALSVYDATGRPVAWAGRPSNLPDERVTGAEALFVAPGPAGLRLVHIRPVTETGSQGRRLGSVAAEHLLTRDGQIRGGDQSTFTFETAQVPVSLRPRYEGAGESVPPYGFLLAAPGEPPVLEATVAPAALAGLRQSWRDGVRAMVLTLLALTLVTIAVILREAHEATHDVRVFVLLVGAIIALLTAARLLLALAVPWAWLLHTVDVWPERLLLRSPADFLATSLYLLALAALGGDLVERWRLMRHQSAREPQVSIVDSLAFWLAQVLAAASIGGLLLLHERALSLVVRESGTFGLQFSLHPFDAGRATALLGIFCLNAAAFWGMVTLLRLAATWWRVRRRAYVLRSAMAAVYLVVPLAVLAYVKWQPLADASALVPAVFAVVVAGGVARWVAPRYRHASQGLRLLVAYFVLAVPSLAFYPAVVALEDASLGDTIARQYTPEVLNHRTDLRVLLRRSLEELDAVPALNEQFTNDIAPSSPSDTDRAYFLWSRTELGRQRLTSSVELYSADGGLLSRFALNLPAEFLLTDRPVDAGCSWVVFGEAPPSTDDHVLLHAGRAICTADADGRVQRTGILLVHVVLDYGTLPFVAAQDPYAALFRPTLRAAERTHGREIAFAVYGWGRTPVYPTAGTAWPISNELLQRIFRTAFQAFWTVLERGDQQYRVLLSNDRAGIYAIGYALPRPVDHAVALAEIGALTGLTFALLLVGLGLLGRAAGRHPVTGRALLREIRQSFYRKLFLLFVAASVVPVLALAFVTRAYVAGQLREGLEEGALRTASAARRVIETVVSQQRRDRNDPNVLNDDVMISVSRIIDQDVNVFVNTGLVATSQRDLFASGLLPTRTPAEAARAITIERQASYVGDERLGLLQYTVAAVPVRDGEAGAILTVPLTLRQQEIEGEIDVLDRRVTLATVLFILLGAAIGYVTAERIADPVKRLTRATGRIARGDLDARIHASTADELRRLVDAFNQMAADLKHQRGELERTNRLAAWADMARQVAHDIKNPLTPIQLSAEHLRRVHKDAGSPLHGVLESCVDTILSQVALLRQISSEFSSFASSPVARPAPTRLSEVIDEVVAPYRAGLPDNVRLAIEETGPLPVLSLDRGLLGRALVNVIENALHAMRGGGTLTLRTSAHDGGAVIEIADTGVGMDAEALAHLFEPYFSTKATGTGLGLTIAKRNVELNGGAIAVTSEKGRGTTVRITLREARPASGGAA
jgi:signal transduction histidine kinase